MHPKSLPPPEPVTVNQIHWRATTLLAVPPVELVSEIAPMDLRKLFARYIDGRHVNDALYRGVQAIRREFRLQPNAYVVLFPNLQLEIPLDLREVSDDPGRFAGFIYEPRATTEVPFDYAEINPRLADAIARRSREEAISAIKELSADGQEFTLSDSCAQHPAFSHHFEDGRYWHGYHYVAATVPEIERGS